MRRTRLSLYYLAGYLIPSGVLLLVLGSGALKTLGSDRDYGPHVTRVLGIMLLVLGVLIVQFIRHRVEALYSTIVVVRVAIVATFLGVYANSGDPVWLLLAVVVGIGVVLTGTSMLLDRRGQ
ncbi:MAG: hypothetical protein EXR64_02030 [Dehalococcoidia bacterium]|nr:hypothetical protein [Dehalococcoidia bacterium]